MTMISHGHGPNITVHITMITPGYVSEYYSAHDRQFTNVFVYDH
jgi:hypothetical protein